MIKMAFKNLPPRLLMAVSGGVDSMVTAHFLSRKREITPVFFHHGTETSEKALHFLKKIYPMLVGGEVDGSKPKSESPEEYWRNQRYAFLDSICEDTGLYCVTGHNLDDQVETWLHSCLTGNPKLIPLTRNRVIRPMVLTRKLDLYKYALRYDVKWKHDATNNDSRYTRNRIRNELMGPVLGVNPGIHNTIRKKVLSDLMGGKKQEIENV